MTNETRTPSPDHCGIVEVDPADFDRELIDAQRAGEKIGRAKGRRFARKVSQRHAEHGARL